MTVAHRLLALLHADYKLGALWLDAELGQCLHGCILASVPKVDIVFLNFFSAWAA